MTSSLPYKTFGRRILSALMDGAIMITCNAIIVAACTIAFNAPIAYLSYIMISFVVGYSYSILTTYFFSGTFGKLAFSLKVVTNNSEKHITLGQSLLREVLNIVLSLLTIVLLLLSIKTTGLGAVASYVSGKDRSIAAQLNSWLGAIILILELGTCLFSEKRRAIHDMIAGTVVRKDGKLRWYFVTIAIVGCIIALWVFILFYGILKKHILAS